MNKEIKEIKNENSIITPDCYKTYYEDGKFTIGFGVFDEEKDLVKVKCEMKLYEEDFKIYFRSMIDAILQYNEITGNDFVKEIMEE